MAEFAETFRLVTFALAALVAAVAYLWIRRREKSVNWAIKRWGVWGTALSLALYGLATALLLIIPLHGASDSPVCRMDMERRHLYQRAANRFALPKGD